MPNNTVDQSISIIDLTQDRRQNLFEQFIALYKQTFTDPTEREDPAEWPPRIWAVPPEPQPRTHLLVAVSDADGSVVGGLVFEHYRSSHCGLLTYLLVNPDQQKKGIARRLVERALTKLIDEEKRFNGKLKAAFCETGDPGRVPEAYESMPPCERLHAMLQLGARILDIDYVQPALAGGDGPCEHLFLLSFDLPSPCREMDDGRSRDSLDARIVYDFLHEFYRALGVADPETSQLFTGMTKRLRNGAPVSRWDPRENPALALGDAAVCIHFVSPPPATQQKPHAYPHCPVFQSMELDLMSYGYQVHKLLGSRIESTEPLALEIVFPEYFNYHTEGRRKLLLARRRTVRARAMVSSTLFLLSGIRVWHLAMAPAEGEVFSEYDIIKLIHLYDGRTESTGLADEIKFRCNSPNKASQQHQLSIRELLPSLVGREARQFQGCEPTAGTIQVIARNGGAHLETILAAFESPETREKLRALIELKSGTPSQSDVLFALCGIITGIFDFRALDDAEILDTMEATFADKGALIKMNRCTMVNIERDDRAMAMLRDSVGISPYLVIPHAALLHNERLIKDSEEIISKATPGKKRNLKVMESAFQRANRNLNRLYVPNIFNYVTERSIFTQGVDRRGIHERLAAARATLDELDSIIKTERERKYEKWQTLIAAILAVVSVLGLYNFLSKVLDGTTLSHYILLIIIGAVALVLLLFFLRGSKK